VPKADGKELQKQLVFKCLRGKEFVPTCWKLWSPVETGGSRQLQNHLHSILNL
jgi:hypothetical protein